MDTFDEWLISFIMLPIHNSIPFAVNVLRLKNFKVRTTFLCSLNAHAYKSGGISITDVKAFPLQ